MVEYLISLSISYLIGSIPTAYLVVKGISDMDIRKVGSGNVGGRNALEVTGKNWVGAVVTLIDALKGIVPIFIATLFFNDKMLAVAAAMFGAVLGHCYPVWLKFHGGRGLATGAGSLLVSSWVWVVYWLILYFASEKLTKNVHASSVIALVAIPIAYWFIPEQWMIRIIPAYFNQIDFFAAITSIVGVCLSRHIDPIKEYFNEK